MNKNNIDLATIKFLYDKYKTYVFSVIIIFVSLALFLKAIIPQIQNFFDIQNQVKIENEKLTVIKKNLSSLSNLNESLISYQLQVSSDALPSSKDFAGILNGVSISAGKAGVFLGDFDFQVGDISKVTAGDNKFPSLQLVLSLNAGVSDTVRFITELYRTVPLAEVKNVQISGNHSSITTVFYYKPFPSLNVKDSDPVFLISDKDLSLIKNISDWNNPNNIKNNLPQALEASKSATISP